MNLKSLWSERQLSYSTVDFSGPWISVKLFLVEKKAQCFDGERLWFVIGITYLIGDIRLVRVIPIRILISCFVCCFQNSVWKLLLFRGSKLSVNGFVFRRIFLEITTALWFEFRKSSLRGVSETSFQQFW